ncbi:hypothetical protein [Paenibacillus sp. RU26A]|nr:hypothetical protein [Paenibacillus sp. RU26A]SLK16653.1 hypothetical protein SAMN06272722_110216 [Paenibacillus sp. RU5A]SOC74430.1 hypothetical protein SAMN05880581_110216 [Paenibacillus sp. RU26A]SOC76603.1 hypothetical protein SAMN05880586_110216 [Paenibacillus sp. RU5M]
MATFWDFDKNDWLIWSAKCQLPSQELAENILLLHLDDPKFVGAVVSPVKLD